MNSQEWTPPVPTDEQRAHLTAWCEDLESGTIKQTRHRLRNPLAQGAYAYCCLGVACNTFKRLEGKGEWFADGRFEPELYAAGSKTALPSEVNEWLLGPNHMNTVFVYWNGETKDVIQLNDNYGVSFEDIAHAVRETYGLPRAAGENKEV